MYTLLHTSSSVYAGTTEPCGPPGLAPCLPGGGIECLEPCARHPACKFSSCNPEPCCQGEQGLFLTLCPSPSLQ